MNYFYLNKPNFKIRYDINENKIFIFCESKLEVDIIFYELNLTNDNSNLLYKTISKFNHNELWFSTNKKLSELKGIKIEILYNKIKIKEEIFKFITHYNNKVKKQVLITHGADGALFIENNKVTEIPTKPVQAIDTVGAGDMFAGCYLYGITNGLNAPDAVKPANHCSAELVSNYGARLPTAKMMEIKSSVLDLTFA